MRWEETMTLVSERAHVIELPHVRGVPIVPAGIDAGTRIREWPNICGHLEAGGREDIVAWRSDLAPRPEIGIVHDMTRRSASVDVGERRVAMRDLAKSLDQLEGVRLCCRGASAACVVLTGGVAADAIHAVTREYPGAIAPVPTRLAEFPGGINLAFVDSAWHRRREYAEAVRQLLAKGG